MPTQAYTQGMQGHAQGVALDANPFGTGTDEHVDWSNGWNDSAAVAAAPAPPDASPEPEPDPAPPAAPPVTTSDTPPTATKVVGALGEAGHARILELLSKPPLDGLPDGANLPPNGEVPEDLGDWLQEWKQPLALVAVDTLVDVVKHRISGTDRGRLKELYRGMSPEAMAIAMQANADAVAKFADTRVAEAAILTSVQTKITQKAVGYLLTALTLL